MWLFGPDGQNMWCNFACVLAARLPDKSAVFGIPVPVLEGGCASFLAYIKVDPELAILINGLRYQAMLVAADSRVAAAGVSSEEIRQNA